MTESARMTEVHGADTGFTDCLEGARPVMLSGVYSGDFYRTEVDIVCGSGIA